MLQTDHIKEELNRSGFLVRDEFLPQALFEKLNKRVLAAWTTPHNWITRVKGPGNPISLPLQDTDKIELINTLLGQQKQKQPNIFTYLYHTLNEENERTGLVAEISRHLIEGWASETAQLGIITQDSQFSLTAFTPFCYLDSHTDFSPNHEKPYLLTLILYFNCPPEVGQACSLKFDYLGESHFINAIPNRSVLFVPSRKTPHAVTAFLSDMPSNCTPRLAVSGWLT